MPPNDGAQKAEFDLDSVYKSVGVKDSPVATPPPTYSERATVYVTYWLGGAILVLSLIVIKSWLCNQPTPPTHADLVGSSKNLTENATAAKVVIENYKSLSEIHNDRSLKIFETMIGNAFLPLFTTLVGYIIGAHKTKRSDG